MLSTKCKQLRSYVYLQFFLVTFLKREYNVGDAHSTLMYHLQNEASTSEILSDKCNIIINME